MEVPPLVHLAVDGRGDPNTSPAYREAVAALYPVAYKIRFLGGTSGATTSVMPLEALWWSDDLAAFTTGRDKDRWQWTLMIMVPDWVTAKHLDAARAAAAERRPPAPRWTPSGCAPRGGALRADAARGAVRRRRPGARGDAHHVPPGRRACG